MRMIGGIAGMPRGLVVAFVLTKIAIEASRYRRYCRRVTRLRDEGADTRSPVHFCPTSRT